MRRIVVCLLLLVTSAIAQDPWSSVEDAFAAQDYAAAESLLLDVVETATDPQTKASAHFNLGNCYFQTGFDAAAILQYRRALLFSPEDKDVLRNLKLTRRRLGLGAETTQESSGPWAGLDSVIDGLGLGWIILLQVIATLGWLVSRRRGLVRWLLGMLIVILMLFTVRLWYQSQRADTVEAIVLDDNTVLRSEPHQSVPGLLDIRPGEVVEVKQESDRWVLVTSGQQTGWVDAANIGVVR